jgi:hypothetical protein
VSDNSRKLPIAGSINNAARQRAADINQNFGKTLPVKVISRDKQLVTVEFLVQGVWPLPQVTMPIASSKFDWLPVKAGDLGLAMPSDVYLGGISGLGGGTADYVQRGNLSTLMYHPVTNKSWEPPGGNGNMRILQGPEGVRIQSENGNSFVNVTPTEITLSVGSVTLVINSSGITLQGKPWLPHAHTGVQPGGGTSGPVA